jgi:prepilin-type N-terminal cleavage/methylation domain-containing protein
MNRRGFTLIEILIACILLGVGVTSVIGVMMVALQRSRQVIALTTIGPSATAAASLVVAHAQVPAPGTDQFIILPDAQSVPAGGIRPVFAWESPWSMRVDRAPDTAASDPDSSSYQPGSPLAAAGTDGADDSRLVTIRVRVYPSPEHRDLDRGCVGVMFIRHYLRARP